ncbi:MAG: copper amine oxidase N-terminal domain-containing protein, partial [Clostridiales bacterium]|nr:copper amine oxidase N-terminal domain-containing protein [Clostridiales bacterium]
MKKEIKGFIVGLIFATMFSGTVAMASTIVREITYGVGVSYNGRPVQFTNDTRPFIMDGRTFLPVRTVAELTGLNVDFVDGVVHLSSGGFVPPAPAPTPTPPSSSGFNISSGGETVRITEAMHYTITPSVSGVWEFRTSNNVG